jgi:aspartyl-tRNA(Asn)/glutamyl-tRNA(Gln) amidotransferase subunit A
VISGHDDRDATSVDTAVPDYAALIDTPPERLRVGFVREFFGEGLDPEVEQAVRQAMRVYEEAGASLREVTLPHTKYGIPAYYIVAPAECSSNLARYDGTIFGHRAEDWSPVESWEEDIPPLIRMMMASRAEGFGAEVKRRIMLGTFALSAGYADQYYNQALKVRRLIRNDFDAAFRDVDVLIGPTSPTAAFALGEKAADPLAMYLSDIYTITTNLAGIAGISIPCGLTHARLPIGLQLLTPAFAEENLLRTARVFERATEWHLQRPALAHS